MGRVSHLEESSLPVQPVRRGNLFVVIINSLAVRQVASRYLWMKTTGSSEFSADSAREATVIFDDWIKISSQVCATSSSRVEFAVSIKPTVRINTIVNISFA